MSIEATCVVPNANIRLVSWRGKIGHMVYGHAGLHFGKEDLVVGAHDRLCDQLALLALACRDIQKAARACFAAGRLRSARASSSQSSVGCRCVS